MPSALRGDPCPACGNREFRILFSSTDRLFGTTDKIFQVVECRGCRLIRLNPQPHPSELHQYYPANYWFTPEPSKTAQLEQFYRRFVMLDRLQFFERALRESAQAGTVLDVGCGGGLFLELIKERNKAGAAGPCIGLDFSLDAADASWRYARVPAVCGSLTTAPFAPGSCSAITMFHVLEHLYDPASYLEAAHRLLAPDGRLIVQVPNASSWHFLLFGERWIGIDIPRHLIDFRASDLDQLLDTCGFEVLRHKYFSMRDGPAGMATSLAPQLDPMARKLRGIQESNRARFWKNIAYLGLVAAAIPFTLLEAVCNAGSTVMVEARKKS